MCTDKTTVLIGLAKVPFRQTEGVLFFQPREAARCAPDRVESRTGAFYDGVIPVDHPAQIMPIVEASTAQHLFLEEVHFLGRDAGMEAAAKQLFLDLRRLGRHTYWSGLPMDFRAQPFELVAFLLGITSHPYPRDTSCAVCKRMPAPFPQRLYFDLPAPADDARFLADTPEQQARKRLRYEPRCSNCYRCPDTMSPQLQQIFAAMAEEYDRGRRELASPADPPRS
ncbi:MAG: hypothetical protein HYY50_03880 [Candidatus Kerfeldbacteria bacterium]|nr:hypothetical protein [Candidatus Kerfeldbacteria bacterium]